MKTGPKESDVYKTWRSPILIPPLDDDAELKLADLGYASTASFWSGCTQDLEPVRLGLDKHPLTRRMPARREDFDRRLCKMAVEMRMPILAIGGVCTTPECDLRGFALPAHL